MHPEKNINVWAGVGTLTNAQRTIICIALIIPQSYCIDPPRIIPITKLPDDSKLMIVPPVSVV